MDYIFVVEIKNNKIAIKNPKYIKNSRTSKIISWSIKKEFYKFNDLVTLQSYSIYHQLKNMTKKMLPPRLIENIKNEFCQEIPIWILEYKEIWDLIKNNLYVQYLPNSKPIKVTKEKLEYY